MYIFILFYNDLPPVANIDARLELTICDFAALQVIDGGLRMFGLFNRTDGSAEILRYMEYYIPPCM